MSPHASPPNRKQLDELDELLKRMLALPVQPSPDDAGNPPAPPVPPPDLRSPAQQPRLDVIFPGLIVPTYTAPAADALRPTSSSDSDFLPPRPAGVPATPYEVFTPVGMPPAPVRTEPARPPSAAAPRPPAAAVARPRPAPAEAEAAVPWPLYPLLGLTLVFDGLLWPFWPLSVWLRHPMGRAVLAWFGVGLLVAAGVLAYQNGWLPLEQLLPPQ